MLRVGLMFSTSYHPQTNGASERTNQRAEIALRYFIAALKDPTEWPSVLSTMQLALNNSTKIGTTGNAPTEILHGIKPREAVNLLNVMEKSEVTPEAFPAHTRKPSRKAREVMNQAISQSISKKASPDKGSDDPTPPRIVTNPQPMTTYRPAHIDAQDAISLAALSMKAYYDAKHTPKFFDVGNLVNLRLHRGYNVPAITSRKLGKAVCGSIQSPRTNRQASLMSGFTISLEDPPSHINCPPGKGFRPCPRSIQPNERSTTSGNCGRLHRVRAGKIVNKRGIRRGRGGVVTQYLVRWKGFGPEHDEWMAEKDLSHAKELVQDYENDAITGLL